MRTRRNPAAEAREAYDRADWEKIGIEVKSIMGPWKEMNTIEALDSVVDKLTKRQQQLSTTTLPICDLLPTRSDGSPLILNPNKRMSIARVANGRRPRCCERSGETHASRGARWPVFCGVRSDPHS
jgi:hypothetical protein